MSIFHEASIVDVNITSQPSPEYYETELTLRANRLLIEYNNGSKPAVDLFTSHHPTASRKGFVPVLLDARQVIMRQNMAGKKLSIKNLRKEAKRLLKDFRDQSELAHHRFEASHPKIRSGKRSLEDISLVDCHHVLAIENGFDSWPKLKHHLNAMDAASHLVKSKKAIDT